MHLSDHFIEACEVFLIAQFGHKIYRESLAVKVTAEIKNIDLQLPLRVPDTFLLGPSRFDESQNVAG